MMRGTPPLFLVLRFVAAMVFAGLGLSQAAAVPVPAVEEVRVQSHGGFTRIVLETNAPIEPNLFTMGGPNRLVIDLPELVWKIPRQRGAVDSALIRNYSFGLFQPGVSRLVLELSGPTRVLGRKLLRYGPVFKYEIDLENLPQTRPSPVLSRSASMVIGTSGGGLPRAATVDAVAKTAFAERRFDPETAEFDRLADALAAVLPSVPNDAQNEQIATPIAVEAIEPSDPVIVAGLSPEAMRGDAAVARERAPDAPAAKPEDPVNADPAPAKKIKRKPLRVVLDPGHGGRDPGTGTVAGVSEKDINLAFAKVLAELLEEDERYEVFLTRTVDKRVKLPDRVAFARRKNADLFISIHADWNNNAFAKGATAYTLSEEASVEALDTIATKREEAGTIAGVDLAAQREDVARLLVDLARRDTQARSVKFAELVIKEVAKETPVLRRPLRRDSFHVLKAPDMPSVLLELGFLSNKTDRELLQSPAWRLKTAEAVKRAVDAFRRATGARDFANR